MAIADHFEVLSRYGAGSLRIETRSGAKEDLVLEGGKLAEQFEKLGRADLLAVLRDADVSKVVLNDGSLVVMLARRAGQEAVLTVTWDDVPTVQEAVTVKRAGSSWSGPWFRPARESEVHGDPLATAPGNTLFALRDPGGATRWFTSGVHGRGVGQMPLLGSVPGVAPDSLGSASFRRKHGVRWAYVAGAMAGGIASTDLVLAMSAAGMLGFYGAGGLPMPAVVKGVATLASQADGPFGCNLLHNPNEPQVEEETVDLYLKHSVPNVSASAYMSLSLAVVRYRFSGTYSKNGRVVVPNQVFAKVSRPEVAEKFLRPPPASMLATLVERGALTEEQAKWAAEFPVAEQVTAEADSGGHTDRRPLTALVPEIRALAASIAKEEGYAARGIELHVGAAGGLGTPSAVWAAFAMGADYVLTGSVNQCTREAGTSDQVKEMLASARFYDVASGPAPDMFEMGAHVQVLSRGSMYANRAQKLYDLYKRCDSLESIEPKERSRLEKQIFGHSLDEVWAMTSSYWSERDPRQVAKAKADPKHKMALTFRWYLGQTSRWARMGEASRKRDFQIWCGPAMGAFNAFVAGTELEPAASRTVVGVSEVLMEGAAREARATVARMLEQR